MLARRQFVGVAVGSVVVVGGGGGLLADAGATPAPRRSSPWDQQTWEPVAGTIVRARDPQGRARRLTVESPAVADLQDGTTGSSFTVTLTSTTLLVEGIYRVTMPSTGTFSAFLATGSAKPAKSATMVVNRTKPAA